MNQPVVHLYSHHLGRLEILEALDEAGMVHMITMNEI